MNNDMMEYYEQEESTNVREFVMGLLNKWYWFVICAVIGVSVAFVVTKGQPSEFKMSTLVLVNDDAKGGGIDALFDGMDLGSKSKVQNHVGVLKSFKIISSALTSLDWQASWFAKGFFKDVALYKGLPFSVVPFAKGLNPCGLPVSIVPISDNKYSISVDGVYLPKGAVRPVEVSFVAEATFGELFCNDLFAFTLFKSAAFVDSDLFFVFNDFSRMTLDYQKRLSVSLLDKKADLIALSIKGESPEREVDFLNALFDEYVKFGLGIKNRTSENVVSFIDDQVLSIVDSLQRASQTFTSFRAKNKTVDLGQEALLVVQSLEKIESEHFIAKMRLDYYDNLRLYMDDESKMKEMVTPSVVGVTDLALNASVMRLGDLYARRSVLASVASKKNPTLILLDGEIGQVRLSLSRNLDNLAVNAANELRALEGRRTRISSELADLPAKEQQLVNIKRDFDLNNELFTFLMKKRAEAAITTASNVSDVQVIDEARVDTAVLVGPKRLMNLIVGFILGLGLPFAFFVLRDYFRDSVLSMKMLEKNTSLPIFGQIAHNASGADMNVSRMPRSIIAECFRSLRTKLHFLLTEESQKVIAVHSAVPSEGKSFCASNLASIIAMSGKRVLLVGCDLRKPSLHNIYDLDNSKGLSNVLINDASFDEVVLKTDVMNLSIVCSGPIPPNPAELLGRSEFADFIAMARENYDFVVLDNAPTLLVTDSSVVSAYADANLFVVRQDFSKTEHVKFVNGVAEKGDFKNVGFIYNDVKKGSSSYGYAYSSYYGEGDKKPGFLRRLFF